MSKSYLFAKTFASKVAAGGGVSSILFPLESAKKIMQQGKQFNFTRSEIFRQLFTTGKVGDYVVYRGLVAFALNVVPTTFLQLTIEQELSKRIPDDAPVPMRILRAMASGAIAGTTATIVENTIVRQYILKSKLRPAFMDMWNVSPARMFKSYPLIAIRDAIFTLNLFFLNPKVEEYLRENFDLHPTANKLISPIPLAVIGATLSHPFDTIATNLQTTHEKFLWFKNYKTVFNTLISGSEGRFALLRGLQFRMPLFYGFLVMIPMAREYCEKRFDEKYGHYAFGQQGFFSRLLLGSPDAPQSTPKPR